MSIANEITALTTDRDNIRSALLAKGVEASSHGFDDFAGDISSITSGVLYHGYLNNRNDNTQTLSLPYDDIPANSNVIFTLQWSASTSPLSEGAVVYAEIIRSMNSKGRIGVIVDNNCVEERNDVIFTFLNGGVVVTLSDGYCFKKGQYRFTIF